MMKRNSWIVGLVLVLAGCIYQSGPDVPDPSAVNVNSQNSTNSTNNTNNTNNVNSTNNTNNSNNTNNTDQPDEECAPFVEAANGARPDYPPIVRALDDQGALVGWFTNTQSGNTFHSRLIGVEDGVVTEENPGWTIPLPGLIRRNGVDAAVTGGLSDANMVVGWISAPDQVRFRTCADDCSAADNYDYPGADFQAFGMTWAGPGQSVDVAVGRAFNEQTEVVWMQYSRPDQSLALKSAQELSFNNTIGVQIHPRTETEGMILFSRHPLQAALYRTLFEPDSSGPCGNPPGRADAVRGLTDAFYVDDSINGEAFLTRVECVDNLNRLTDSYSAIQDFDVDRVEWNDRIVAAWLTDGDLYLGYGGLSDRLDAFDVLATNVEADHIRIAATSNSLVVVAQSSDEIQVWYLSGNSIEIMNKVYTCVDTSAL